VADISNSQKALIAVVVVVIVLFVLAIANQQRSGEGIASEQPSGLVGAVGRLVGDPAAVDRAELSSACLQPDGRLVFRGSCTLRVAPSNDRLRTVRLRPRASITVSTTVPEDDIEVERDVDANAEVTIAVDRDGAAIVLNCRAATCPVELVTEQ